MDKWLSIEKRNKILVVSMGFALIGLIGVLDFLTGYEFSFSVFYLLPIALITWLTSRALGVIASLVSAGFWLWADLGTGHSYSHSFIPIWNSVIRFGYFEIINWLLSTLKTVLLREKALGRVDPLTGALNSRSFYELTQIEIDRLQRYQHSFTIAYLDLDNFKAVNDQSGHLVGNQVLCSIVRNMHQNLRKTDKLGRLGGDEFALLLPETNQESARSVLSKIHRGLSSEMQARRWPITFSIGVLTCNAAPFTPEEILKLADDLMYEVKGEGKNAIRYSTFNG